MCQAGQIETGQRIGGVMLAPSLRPDIVPEMESENSTDKVFTGQKVSSLNDALMCVSTKCNIQTPASIKTRPAGCTPVSFLKRFCQVCRAESCLIAVHHFWGPLGKERNQFSSSTNPSRIKSVSHTVSSV